MRLPIEYVVFAQEGPRLEDADLLRKGEVFHFGKLLSQDVLHFWLLLPFLDLKVGLLALVLVRQLLLHFKVPFEDDKNRVDRVILRVYRLSSQALEPF